MSSFNLIDTLFTKDVIAVYLETSPHRRASLAQEHLYKKLKENPHYEVFLPYYYIRSTPSRQKEKETIIIHIDGWFISNHGRILSFKRHPHGRILKTSATQYGHQQIVYDDVGGRRHAMILSRAVGCVFIPCPRGQQKYMEVKHRDNDFNNPKSSNLYWEYPSFGN